MREVIELPPFQKRAADIWTEDEREEFLDWIALNPTAGDAIPRTKPQARKVRWKRQGTGKSSGVRVIFYDFAEQGILVLLTCYAKSNLDTMTHSEINKLARREGIS